MPRLDPAELPASAYAFLRERHLATLSTVRPDDRLHVVPVGFTFDPSTATAVVITSGDSVKARNSGRPGAEGALCSVDGARWLTLSGPLQVSAVPADVAEAERRYAERYRTPRINPKRVAITMTVTSVLASVRLG